MVQNTENIAETIRKNVILSYKEIQEILDNLNSKTDDNCPYGIVDYKASDKKNILSVFIMGTAGTKDFKSITTRLKKDEKYSDFDIWVILKDNLYTSSSLNLLKNKTDNLIKKLNSPYPITFWFISESSYRDWSFFEFGSEESYLGLASNHLKDYFLSTKTLIAGKEIFSHTVSEIPPQEGYELSIISLMQAYKGNPAKAALRAALGLLIASQSINPISEIMEKEAEKNFSPEMSRYELIKISEKLPTVYDIIFSKILEKEGSLFTAPEVTLLHNCYKLKSGLDSTEVQKLFSSKNPSDITLQKKFIENTLNFITQMQMKLKDRYLYFLKGFDKNIVIKKLTDLKIYTRMLLSWESRHIINDLIKNIRLHSIFIEQDKDDNFIIQYLYQEGIYINSKYQDLFDALSEIARVKDVLKYIRFKGSVLQAGYDRKSALSLLEILSNFIYTPSCHPTISSMYDYIHLDIPEHILIIKTDAGFTMFYKYPYGRTGRLMTNLSKYFSDIQSMCNIFYVKIFKQGLIQSVTLPQVTIQATDYTGYKKLAKEIESEFIEYLNILMRADEIEIKINYSLKNN
ncbi:MAG: hypothetical protein AB1765_03220 [Candidatus Hydrogenedentota bacterium]